LKRGLQGRYTKELREEAVKLIIEGKLSLPEAARRLSLPLSTLGKWIKAYKERLGEIGSSYRPLTELELELALTKKELAYDKMLDRLHQTDDAVREVSIVR
jgi:transposase-like protein